jgi:hypothetical protein
VAAVTIMVCVFAAATGVARAERSTLERIEARAPQVKRWTGWLVAAVDVWFLVLAVFADFFADLFPV